MGNIRRTFYEKRSGNAGTDAFGGNDFSFSRDADLNGAACQAGQTLGWCPLWCKDAAARCVVRVTPQLDGRPHPLFAPFSVTVPRDVDGDGVADINEKAQVNGWNGLYANVTNAAKVWIPGCWGSATNDTELAELGLMRTDGDYSHGAGGDGLSILDEYRGYVLDGGTNGFAAGHHRLSFSRKELLVEVSELPSLAEKGANSLNPAAATNFNSHAVMTAVADFYSNPTRGMGIDLYWATDVLTLIPVGISISNPETNEIIFSSTDLYRYFGIIVYYGNNYHAEIDNASMHVMNDTRTIANSFLKRLKVEFMFSDEEITAIKTLYNKNNCLTFVVNARNANLPNFVKLVFTDRHGKIRKQDWNSMPVGIADSNNAITCDFESFPVEYQASIIYVIGMAEERPVIEGGIHYTKKEFLDSLNFATAHEIGHLITLKQKWSETHANSTLDNKGHLCVGNALMGAKPLNGLSDVTAVTNELCSANLTTRLSVKEK